jgi:hypothetical protein
VERVKELGEGEGRKKNGEVGPDASDSIGGSGSSWSNEFVEKQKMTQTQEEVRILPFLLRHLKESSL